MEESKKTGGFSKDRPKRKRPPRVNVNFGKKVKLEVCHHVYCMGDGAKYSYKRLQNELNLKDGETTEDGKVTIDKCGCLGHCKKGPNIKLTYTEENKEEVLEHMNAFKVGDMIKQYKDGRKK